METEVRVNGLIDRWEALREQGTPFSIEALCSDCPELVTELERRIRALTAMDSVLDTGATEVRATRQVQGIDGARPDRGLPDVLRAEAVYRPQQHHAHGGLGVVFTAQQEELDRLVAVKRIRPDKLRDPARRRFLREAAITARLQHPGIVPIYGLGHDDDGPFYTMPFIQGQTLQSAIDGFHADDSLRRDHGKRSLRFRALLQQFITVCNTVAYAHDEGVVHRDLKPSNIMLGSYGETLVMDWGLAKRFDSEDAGAPAEADAPSPSPSPEEVTAAGYIVGTPRYMSPEQARGEPAGPASDIFSLGLVLYGILTGRSAFAETSFQGADPLKAVREAAIVPPRGRDPGLSRGLEAICLKALAARVAERYPSAHALAEDVTRWLADEPVTACHEPVWARARRWARRHRSTVAAAVVALFALAIGLGAVAAVQARAKDKLKRSDDQTKAALAQSEASRTQAEAVTDYLVEAFRSADPGQDGRQVKVADVLDRAAKRLDEQFAGSQATRGALLQTLGMTYMGLGLSDRAETMMTKAVAVRQVALGARHRETLTSRASLAVVYTRVGKVPEAIAQAEETLKLRDLALGPDDADSLASRGTLASALWSAGRTQEAIALYEATLPRVEATLGRDHRGTLTWRNNLAASYVEVGQILRAIKLHEVTLAMREATLGPEHPDTLQSRGNLAIAYQEAGRTSEAIVLYEETFPRMEAVLGPDHPETLAVRNNLGNSYMAAGRTSEAIALFAATVQRIEAKLRPDHPLALIGRGNLALAYVLAGRTGDASALLEPTIKLLVAALGPDHPTTLAFRSVLASAYESLGRWSEAEALFRDTVARRRQAVEPDSPPLAADLIQLGRHLLNQSRWSDAEPLAREALAIRDKAMPDDWPRFEAMSVLGGALVGQRKFVEAEPLVVAGYEGMKAREARIELPRRSLLQEAAEQVVRMYEAWGQPEKATAWKARLGMPDLPADVFARP